MLKKIFGITLLILSITVRSEAEEHASTNVGVEILKFGESERLEKGQVTATPGLIGGLTDVQKIRFVNEGSIIIPAVKGKGMAVVYKITGEPIGKEIVLDMRSIHPPILDPTSGKVSTTGNWFSKKTVGTQSFRDYEFTEEWEVVAGEWIFEFWYEGKKLNSQKFIVN
ncbi:MAG: DUF3859 domain-containing protein [Gammaproteobacteria bacterium]|nr:MAG: DUF3859 domain-containing protein [Gammaproteobacteria bacterium]